MNTETTTSRQTYGAHYDTLQGLTIVFVGGHSIDVKVSDADKDLIFRTMQANRTMPPIVILDWNYRYLASGSRVYSNVCVVDFSRVEMVRFGDANVHRTDEVVNIGDGTSAPN